MSRFAFITLCALAVIGFGATVGISVDAAVDAATEVPAPVAETAAPDLPQTSDATTAAASSSTEAPVEIEDLETLRAEIFQAGWPPFGGGNCNQTTCGSGQFCCNYSCSICAPFGSACTDVYCPPAF